MGDSSSSSSSSPTSAKAGSDPSPGVGADAVAGPRDGPGRGDIDDGGPLSKTQTHAKEVWKFRLRPDDDNEPE